MEINENICVCGESHRVGPRGELQSIFLLTERTKKRTTGVLLFYFTMARYGRVDAKYQ